jgi:hypothetical protein
MVSTDKAGDDPVIATDYRCYGPSRQIHFDHERAGRTEKWRALMLGFRVRFPVFGGSPAMHRLWSFLLMFSLAVTPFAFGQTAKQKAQPAGDREVEGQQGPAEAAAPHPGGVPPDAPVITIIGLCDTAKSEAASSPADCKTVVTRAEFETLANDLRPDMPGPVRRQLANAYSSLLVMSKEAQRRGVDKDPHYLESVQFAKLRLLAQELSRQLQEEASSVPPQDIQAYYDKNTANYEQAALQRVFIPRTMQVEAPQEGTTPDQTKAREKQAEDAMTRVAEYLRARAVAGEDFDKLEKAAYDAAGLKVTPPATSIPKIRRSNLPPAHAVVFELKPGEITQLISDPSGHYFYKLDSKTTMPLDEVRQEIHATLQNQRMREEVQKLQESVTTNLNEAYFGEPPAQPVHGVRPASASPKPAPKAAEK